MKKLLFSLYLCLLLPTFAWAQQTKVYYAVRGKKPQLLRTKSVNRWSWKEPTEGKPRMVNETLFALPGNTIRNTVKSKYGEAQLKGGGKKLFLSSHYLTNMVLVSDGQRKEKFFIKTKLEKKRISNGCEESYLILQAKDGNEFPGPLGTFCKKQNDSTLFSVAFPGEVNWSGSTLFETEGKGESWKVYEISEAQSQSGGKIGNFSVQYKNKTYEYELLSNYSKSQAQNDSESNRYQLLVGNVSLTAKDATSEASESPFFVGGRFLSRPIFSSLRLGVDFNISQSFNSDPQNQPLNYKEFRAFAGYGLLGGDFEIAPRIYTIFADASNPNSGLKMVHQHLGLGLAFILKLGPDFRTHFVYLQSGFLGSVPTTHSSLQFEAAYNFGGFEAGFGIEMNDYGYETQTRGNPEFTQAIYYLSLGF